jgi:hypothetical protein
VFARLSASVPEWEIAAAALKSALSEPSHAGRLQHAVAWFFRASGAEIEACIETILDLDDVSRQRVSETLIVRYRKVCRYVHAVARKELRRAASQLVTEDRDLGAVLRTLRLIENNSNEALSYFNHFVSRPSPRTSGHRGQETQRIH